METNIKISLFYSLLPAFIDILLKNYKFKEVYDVCYW